MSGESIYNLIPQPVPLPQKEPLYKSKHNGAKPPTFSTFGLVGTSKPGYSNVAGGEGIIEGGQHEYKKSFATFGKEGNAVPPTDILKKCTGGGGAHAAAIGLSQQSEQTHIALEARRLRTPAPARRCLRGRATGRCQPRRSAVPLSACKRHPRPPLRSCCSYWQLLTARALRALCWPACVRRAV